MDESAKKYVHVIKIGFYFYIPTVDWLKICSVLQHFSLQVWRLENEFYNFALDHFHFIRKKTLIEVAYGGGLVDRGQNFVYGKIKPKKS